MRPTRKPRKRPALTNWRTVSAEQPQRSASVSGVKGLSGAIATLPMRHIEHRGGGLRANGEGLVFHGAASCGRNVDPILP
jgi:hypothetical protein